MPSLGELQRSLADSLAAPAQVVAERPGSLSGDGAIRRARSALIDKRARAAARLLPRCRAVLADSWRQRFAHHASVYAPCGLLYHVDDAWALALSLTTADHAALRRAAHDDLVSLRLQWKRRP